MEKILILILCVFVIAKCIISLPVSTKHLEVEDNDDNDFDDEIHKLSYKKYLKEVMSLLMTDEGFKKKIMTEGKGLADKAKEFSTNLEFISHNIRSRLDELKRKELERLRNLMKLKAILKQSLGNLSEAGMNMNAQEKARLLGHIDHLNVHSFEASDLEKLIVQTSRDLQELDIKRKEAFKIYEMEKELEKRRMLEGMDGKKRQEEERKLKMMDELHKNHSKMHHPGNEAHLLDIWDKVDGMDRKDFDHKTFFHLHDVNGDGLWDHNEVEALFQYELDKVYNKDSPEDDLVERYEEMNRMREHFTMEADNNKDGVVNLQEFLIYSSKEEFLTDEEWKAIDGKEVFDENDLKVHRIKLEKLKLQSLEGVNEELHVEIPILGNSSRIVPQALQTNEEISQHQLKSHEQQVNRTQETIDQTVTVHKIVQPDLQLMQQNTSVQLQHDQQVQV